MHVIVHTVPPIVAPDYWKTDKPAIRLRIDPDAECARVEASRAAGIAYIPMIAMSFTVPLTPAIFAASVALPVARSTL
jgi:hypothetical protein